MLKIFFISALVFTTNTPEQGWLQNTQTYESKPVCEAAIKHDYENIIAAIKAHLGKTFEHLSELRCMTHHEAVERNTALGH